MRDLNEAAASSPTVHRALHRVGAARRVVCVVRLMAPWWWCTPQAHPPLGAQHLRALTHTYRELYFPRELMTKLSSSSNSTTVQTRATASCNACPPESRPLVVLDMRCASGGAKG